jgi:hypothetical protein
MSIVLDGTSGITTNSGTVVSTTDATLNGLTVGKGGGSVSTNTAVGASALATNSSGASSTAVGYLAGSTNTTGASVTAFGYQAGKVTTTTNSGTYIGANSGLAATGQQNTFLGQGSGETVTSGAKNTIIGRYDGNTGGLDIRTASNYIVLSDGDGNPRGYFNNTGNFLVGTNSTTGPQNNSGQGVEVYNPANNGRINFGKTSSGTLDGIVFYYNNPTNTYVGGLTYSNTATALVTSSDIRLKQNIVDIDSQFSTINAIKVREFEFIAEPDKKVKGFVAQELFEVFPDAVQVGTEKEDGSIEKGWAVNQTALIPIMLKAIQELKTIVDAQAAEIVELKAKVA